MLDIRQEARQKQEADHRKAAISIVMHILTHCSRIYVHVDASYQHAQLWKYGER